MPMAAPGKSDFQIGDEVRLRSEMKLFTVASVDEDQITCEWLDDNNELSSWDFNARMLVFVRRA